MACTIVWLTLERLSRLWPEISICKGLPNVSNAGRLNSYCTPGKSSNFARIVFIAWFSVARPAPSASVMLNVPLFSPASTGFASNLLPVPATE